MTPRQKTFAVAVGNGMSLTDAAKHAGFAEKSARVRGQKLMREPEVAALVEAEREKALAETRIKGNFDLNTAMAEYDAAIEFAKKTSNASAYVKAVDSKAKLVGLMDQKDIDPKARNLTFNFIGVDIPGQVTAVQVIDNG
jgi:CBS-domain-containing membrane protein